MTRKEQDRLFEEGCKEMTSSLNCPVFGTVLTPICFICNHFDNHPRTYDPPTCSAYEIFPKDVLYGRTNNCENFSWNEKAPENLEFDENHKPLRTIDNYLDDDDDE